jgi:mono/diheme cytochrome c family protein
MTGTDREDHAMSERKMAFIIAGLSVLGLAVLAGALPVGTPPGAAETVAREPVRQPELKGRVAFGKMAYDKYCAGCHGVGGVGTDKGPPFLHKVYHPGHHGDAAFRIAAARGTRAHHWQFGDMPPVEGVSEKQVDMIIDYVRALQRANGLF